MRKTIDLAVVENQPAQAQAQTLAELVRSHTLVTLDGSDTRL